MIDFRYHLVSLIAVFLAVALGIIIGTTALNEPIQADIEGQVTDLQQDKRSLEDRTQQLQNILRAPELRQPPALQAAYAAVVAGEVAIITTLNTQIDKLGAVVGDYFGRHRDAEI